MSQLIKIKIIKDEFSDLNHILKSFITSLNFVQRLALDEFIQDKEQYRPSFLISPENKDVDGSNLWTNGARIVSYDFENYSILFSWNGQKNIMISYSDGEIFAGLSVGSRGHKADNIDIMNRIAADINKNIIDTIEFSEDDGENYSLIY